MDLRRPPTRLVSTRFCVNNSRKKRRIASKLSLPHLEQFNTFPENFVILTPMTCELWPLSQDMAGQKGNSTYSLCHHDHSFVINHPYVMMIISQANGGGPGAIWVLVLTKR